MLEERAGDPSPSTDAHQNVVSLGGGREREEEGGGGRGREGEEEEDTEYMYTYFLHITLRQLFTSTCTV